MFEETYRTSMLNLIFVETFILCGIILTSAIFRYILVRANYDILILCNNEVTIAWSHTQI